MSTHEYEAGGGAPVLARSLYKRFALGALLIVLMTAATVATAVLLQVKEVADIIQHTSVPIPGIHAKGVLDDVDPGGPQTILLLGSDRRFVDIKEKNAARSDTIMLLRLDPSKAATAVMSLPRDLRVQIPGHGTGKINAAYSIGGPKLAVRTVRSVLGGLSINHVVNVNFGGFQRAVNRVKCLYIDVDRHYYNDNQPPAGGGPPYATIDVKAGYQRLCGSDSLDYVRFRHLDSDIVRGARQQDFLRQAKDQIGLGRIFGDRKNLLSIFGHYTQTDIRGSAAILRLIKLVADSAGHPVQEVHFDVVEDGNDLVASPDALLAAKESFLNVAATKGPRAKPKVTNSDRKRQRRQSKGRDAKIPPGLFDGGRAGEDAAINLMTHLHFPAYYPRFAAVGSQYSTTANRAYTIVDRGKREYEAYRLVVSAPGVGQYYGIQGTTWKAPPILDNPSETRRMVGRDYKLYFDGSRLRLVAWQTPRASYWISNTLLESLTNRQMLGIARSLRRIGQ